MSVSYHLVPVDKETQSFIGFNYAELNLNNDFSSFAELMINYPDQFIAYFDKHELFFDFIYSLNQSEISKITYQPERLKSLFIELLEILKTKEGFPIKEFNYFGYEDMMASTFLYVNLKGSELNKIVEDKIYHKDSDFDVQVSFDKWNNNTGHDGNFKQNKTNVYIKTSEGENFNSILDLSSFPGELKVNRTLSNINLSKEIKQVSLVLKTPYQHLLPTFNNLIAICNVCITNGYGIKSYVEC